MSLVLLGRGYRGRLNSSGGGRYCRAKGGGHRVGRVLSFFSSRQNWESPTPLAAGECLPPPFGPEGRAHSLAGEELGESQFRRGDMHCGALCTVYKYFVGLGNGHAPPPSASKAENYHH
jgi:hypothetical protein